MKDAVLNIYAKNSNGKYTHISNASPDMDYYCPVCNEKFIFKQGSIRQHHFAHSNSFSNCSGTGEGYLHKTFKNMLSEYLKNNINSQIPTFIKWKCNICTAEHNGNLLHDIIDVKTEYNLTECRPDIALIPKNGNMPIIIEIIDKHEPEKNVIDYCEKNKIVLIKIKLNSINDLEDIENKIKHPTDVIYAAEGCPNYRQYILSQNIRPVNIGVSEQAIRRKISRERSHNRF
ncbi:MAG: competence protein CoiA [Spirochaetes bacterium]|nr:competence protein CoiA [Spirochaetota bacterium]